MHVEVGLVDVSFIFRSQWKLEKLHRPLHQLSSHQRLPTINSSNCCRDAVAGWLGVRKKKFSLFNIFLIIEINEIELNNYFERKNNNKFLKI